MICPTCKTHYEAGAFCATDGTALLLEGGAGLIGKVLADRYRIVRLLGEGGMGQVFEAQHLNINKRFALKLLRPEVVGSASSLARFRQEAWAASSIGHANIVEIDDFATLPSGEVYLAMEFLDGQSLAERMRDGPPLRLPEALQILIAVGQGLAAAHDKGIVHRDMKPENIFLARKGSAQVAKILDFGIAKVTGADEPSNLTRTGAIFGTPLYMSPEQAKGQPADARADVYALGIILYEAATGSVPFGGESSVQILSQQIAATPVAPSRLAPEREIPPALEAAILRALAKEPAARFATMTELVAALQAVAATLPAPAQPEPSRTPTPLPPALRKGVDRNMAAVAGAPSRTPSPSIESPPIVAAPMRRSNPPLTNPPPDLPLTNPPLTNPPLTNPPATLAPATTSAQLAAARSSTPRNVALALAALVVVFGLGWLLWPHAQKPALVATLPPVATPPPTPPPLVVPTPPPTQVIVDSVPTGAQILRDDKVVGETPETLALAAPASVVLRKDGFTDKTVAIDPAAAHKVLVTLERARRSPKLAANVAGAKDPTVAAPPKTAAAATRPVALAAAKPAPQGKAVTAAKGAHAPKDNDVPLEPYGAMPTKPVAARKPVALPAPAKPSMPSDALGALVEHAATQAEPGARRLGEMYKGVAADEGGRSDWFVELPVAQCYTFFGEGGNGVKALYLYLWGPTRRRVKDMRESSPHARMTYCTELAGLYHFQAKVDDGAGEYRVGIYHTH
jgi:serine/threonine protein kinase